MHLGLQLVVDDVARTDGKKRSAPAASKLGICLVAKQKKRV
jgi:hypothetical protein